jgi:hypothetical protein
MLLYIVVGFSRVALRLALGLFAVVAAAAPGTASAAAITFSNGLGSGAAPSTLGPFTMQPFNPLGSGAVVSSVTGPTGAVGVSPAMYDTSGSYPTNGTSNYLVSTTSVSDETFTLPAGTGAFYVYIGWECNCGGGVPTPVSMTATAQDGTSSGPVTVNPGAPEYFGFYAACGGSVQTVKLSVTGQPWVLTAGAFGIASATCAVTSPKTGAQVSCNYEFATLDDICTALISSGTSVSPTGNVGFKSNAGGVFSGAGNSCALTPVSGNAGVAQCSVTYVPPATGSPTITASYGGDAHNTAASATTSALLSQSVASVIANGNISPPSFIPAPNGPSFTIARVFGAIVRFKLRAPAVVRFTVQRPRAGRKGSKGLCVAPSKGNAHRPRCTRYGTLRGSFSLTPRVGANSFRFYGRIGGRTLSPGHYRLVGSPSIAGVPQKPVVIPFSIK